jgi:hypothetical protein
LAALREITPFDLLRVTNGEISRKEAKAQSRQGKQSKESKTASVRNDK